MFFQRVESADEDYKNLSPPCAERLRGDQEYIESLWEYVCPYLSADLPVRAVHQFHPVFWEMYLTAAMLDRGLLVVPSERRRFRRKGPDLQVGDDPVWIEAVAVSRGISNDAVSESPPGVAVEVPDDGIKLRLLSGIRDKLLKHDHYVQRGIVHMHEPFVIAINAGRVPSASLERQIPRVIRTLLPIGDESIQINCRTGCARSAGYTFQGSVRRASGAVIATTLFQDQASAGLSAVIYSADDVLNRPSVHGDSFTVIHNPMARNPIQARWLPCSREWFVEEGTLTCQQGSLGPLD